MVSVASLAVFGVAIALLFDFLNGFHDAANAIATIVITKVLTPFQAVVMAGVANFAGALFFSVAVATTIGKGIVDPSVITVHIIIAALFGAVIWNLITWYFGLPSSSSHALIGGLIGSVIISKGISFLNFLGILKIILFIFIAPVLGLIGSAFLMVLIMNIFKKSHPDKLHILFRRLQLASSFFYSLGHGTNDAQKTMGIIAILLLTGGFISSFYVPFWVIFSCYTAIGLGTFFGGWRIVKTMGTKITKIRSLEGFCAEASGGLVLMLTALAGIPVSTTHVIAGSIMGVGIVENSRTVRWNTARRMVWAWILTIPLTAVISACSYLIIMGILSEAA